MKAEVIFDDEGELVIAITAESQTEFTTLKHVAPRFGLDRTFDDYRFVLKARANEACSDCAHFLALHSVLCLAHTKPEDRPARAKAIGVVR